MAKIGIENFKNEKREKLISTGRADSFIYYTVHSKMNRKDKSSKILCERKRQNSK